jgi:hypothetical protein
MAGPKPMADVTYPLWTLADPAAARALADSVDDADLVRHYLGGMCGPLALAIHERTGWETVGLFDPKGGMWDGKPRHVGCRAPDGGYADARGTGLDAAAFGDGYRDPGGGDLQIRPFGPDLVRLTYSTRSETHHLLAAEHVDRLLPELPAASPARP